MIFRRSACSILVAASVSAAAGSVRTTVDLQGDPGPAHRLAMPGVAVKVEGLPARDAGVLAAEVEREMRTLAYTRQLASGETGDYDLAVRAGTRVTAGSLITIPFEIVLSAAAGSVLWRTNGRTEIDAAPVDDQALLSIARNVVSALMHDGWIQQRIDPHNLPPPPPPVRRS